MTRNARLLESELRVTLPFAALIPESLARYRLITLAAIDFFINRLPPDRQAVLDRGWVALSPNVPPEVRLLELLHVCPTQHKLGQVLAREPKLPGILATNSARATSSKR